MKLQPRRVVALLLSVLLCLVALPSLAQEPIRVVLDGKPLVQDVPPNIVDGRVLVPLRSIFEALGAIVGWDPATKRIVGERGGSRIELTVGSTQALVNGRPVQLSVPPQIVDGRTMVPVRFISEALGDKVEWDPATRTVLVTRQSTGPDLMTALLGPGDLPFPGFTVLEDKMEKGWHRYFVQGSKEAAGGPLMMVAMVPLNGVPQYGVEKTPCPPGETEWSRPKIGDAARACYRNRNGGVEMTLTVAWRDRIIMVSIYDLEDDKDFVYGLALLLANHQLDILTKLAEGRPRPAPPAVSAFLAERLAKRAPAAAAEPAPVTEPAVTEETTATVAARLRLLDLSVTPAEFAFGPVGAVKDATAGADYAVSLCAPAVDEATDLCGWPNAANPQGGRPPYQFYSEFSFPSIGLSLLSNGLLTGRPPASAAGKTYPFRICAKDLAGATACQDAALTVQVAKVPAQPLQFNPESYLPWARVGQPYRYAFCNPEPAVGVACGEGQAPAQPTGGVPPYSFRAAGLGLPAGLTLSANGILSGKPGAGTYVNELTICAVDGAGTDVCRQVQLLINQNTEAPLLQDSAWKGTFTVNDPYTKVPYSGSFSFRFGKLEAVQNLLPLTDVALSFHDPHGFQRASIYCSPTQTECTMFDITFYSPKRGSSDLSFRFDAEQDYLAAGQISPTTIQGTAFYMGSTAGTFSAVRQ